MQDVLVFGQLGKAVFQKNEDIFLVDLDRPAEEKIRQGDISFLFDSGTEIKAKTYPELEPGVLKKELEEMQKGHDALEMVFDCFDPDFDEEVLLSCAEAAEELLADEEVVSFVTKRMFSRPLPERASRSFSETIIAENKFPNLNRFLSSLFNCQQAIESVSSAWESVANQNFTDIHLACKTQNALVEEGAFALAVRALFSMDKNKLGLLPIEYLKNPDLKFVPNLRKILTALYTEIKIHLPKEKDPEIVSEQNLFKPVKSTDSRKLKKGKRGVHFDPERIFDLKCRTVQSYFQGRTGEAEKLQKELFDYQMDSPKYLCMSLCDIAGQIGKKVGLSEKAIEIYKLAVKKNITDPVAWRGMAEVYKAMREYPTALEKYKRAQELDPSDVVAWNGMAEVYKAMNLFDEAEEKYVWAKEKLIPDPYTFCGLGFLWLKVKPDEKGTECDDLFKSALKIDPGNPVASLGRGVIDLLFDRRVDKLAGQEWFEKALAFLSEDKNPESRKHARFIRDLESIDRDDPLTRTETFNRLSDTGSYLMQEMPL